MTIRYATDSDIDIICALVERMHAESKYSELKYEPLRVQQVINSTIHDSDSTVIVCEDLAGEIVGFLALEQIQYTINFESFVVDSFFYVLPTHRMTTAALRLIQAGEAWAAEKGDALILVVAAPHDTSKTARLYGKLGYEHWGVSMRKAFKNV